MQSAVRIGCWDRKFRLASTFPPIGTGPDLGRACPSHLPPLQTCIPYIHSSPVHQMVCVRGKRCSPYEMVCRNSPRSSAAVGERHNGVQWKHCIVECNRQGSACHRKCRCVHWRMPHHHPSFDSAVPPEGRDHRQPYLLVLAAGLALVLAAAAAVSCGSIQDCNLTEMT